MKSIFFFGLKESTVEFIFGLGEKQLFETIKDKYPAMKSYLKIEDEISEIAKFCRSKISGLLDVNSDLSPISSKFNYNIVEWIDEGCIKRLKNYEFEHGKEKICFEYTNDQIVMRRDYFKRYGTDINALSKIVTRIAGLESQFRKIKNNEFNELRNIYKKVDDQWLTKYAMSG